MKKVLFGVIVLVLGISNFVFAKTYDLSQINQVKLVTEYDKDTTVDEMDTVTFGSYPQSDASGNTKELIEWIVLDRQGDKTLLLSKYILDCKCYNNKFEDVTWETSSLRNWLNSDFYDNAFNGSEQEKIQTTNVITNNNIFRGTKGGNNTQDKIFSISIEEVRRYFGNGNQTATTKKWSYSWLHL